MCGIAGLWRRGGADADALRADALAMARALAHRGPDGEGCWTDPAAGIALAHRRLSIIDLSDAGAQPMATPDDTHVLSFNGEIYNFAELRGQLEAEGVAFRSQSDSEVLLHACSRWGVDRTLPRLVGMFAFAIWDARRRRLTLARDRLGIKPLYWGTLGDLVLFGSEPAALRACPGWTAEIDRPALATFLRHGYIPAPSSIYRGIAKLPPGALVEIDDDARVRHWWDPRELAPRAVATRTDLDPDALLDELEATLTDAVRARLVADVPVGCLLSGGIDSSLVTALAARAADRQMQTFTIGFAEGAGDESRFAESVAAALGTAQRTQRLSADRALALIPELPLRWSEPFADSSQLPTQLVSRMAREHVTVVLSGDGGDELFDGYKRYPRARAHWARLSRLPRGLRRVAGAAVRTLPIGLLDLLLAPLGGRLGGPPGDRLHKAARLASAATLPDYYRQLISQWRQPAELLPGVIEAPTPLTDTALRAALTDPTDWMGVADTLSYLPGDILTKVDRATMSVGLEARVPILDHRVVELSWRIPPALRRHDGVGKWPLRALLAKHVPRELFERPKQGFAIPLGDWLRGPLREWAEPLLTERALRDSGLEPGPVRRRWTEHVEGRRRWAAPLWTVLMWQAWHARWMTP